MEYPNLEDQTLEDLAIALERLILHHSLSILDVVILVRQICRDIEDNN